MAKKNNLEKPIYKDFRGEIRRLDISWAKFNILFTRAGMLRSGDSHPNIQFDLLLKGKLEITFRKGNKDVKKNYRSNQLIKIPPKTPHLFHAITDTVMIEWWDGELKVEYYQPYRKLIEDQFREFEKHERK